MLLVVLIDLPGEVRNVNTTITLTRDEKFVFLKLREFSVERLKSGKGILRLLHVIGVPVSIGASDRVTNTSRRLNVENRLLSVPWEWVLLNVALTIIDDARTVFV